MNTDFIDLSNRGKNLWRHYFLGIFLIFIFWVFLGALVVGISILSLSEISILQFLQISPENHLQENKIYIDDSYLIPEFSTLTNYILLNIPQLTLLLGIVFVTIKIHKRPLITLITPKTKINWGQLRQGFFVYFILICLATSVEYFLYPSQFTWHFNLKQFIPFACIALILTPLQTTAEELLFRGYLLQFIGKIVKSPLILATVSGFVFMIPHFSNPEMQTGSWAMAANYYILGFFFTMITLRSRSLELACGVHAANNLFACLVVNYSQSALSTESIFFTSHIDPVYSLKSFIVIAIVFYLIVFRKRSETFS